MEEERGAEADEEEEEGPRTGVTLGSQKSEVMGYEGEVRYPWNSYPGLPI